MELPFLRPSVILVLLHEHNIPLPDTRWYTGSTIHEYVEADDHDESLYNKISKMNHETESELVQDHFVVHITRLWIQIDVDLNTMASNVQGYILRPI